MTDLINTAHREALALAVFEQESTPPNTLGTRTYDSIRLQCENLQFRTAMLSQPRLHERYVAIRGFDPREVRTAPHIRWLDATPPTSCGGTERPPRA